MNIVAEHKISGEPIDTKAPKRPVRPVLWFVIVAVLLGALVGGLVWFNSFRGQMIKQFFANNKPPPVAVSAAEAKLEVIPNLLTAVGGLAAVHQVDVSADVNGRVTEIKFEPGAHVEAGTPLVQMFDAPEQGDLANYKAQATGAQLSLDRAKQLASRQFGPQATVDTAQAAYDQAMAGIAKTEALISQKLVRAPFSGDLGVRKVEVGQYLTAGTAMVSLTDLSQLFANFTVTEKDSGNLKVGQTVRLRVDAYPGRTFEGKITTIEPQIASDTRNIRVQATVDNPEKILKPGMFVTTTVVLPDKPAVITVPETAVDYTLYGDSVLLITEKTEDGKTSLNAVRTFVQTGTRLDGRVEIVKGIKPGDKVVAVGQLKVQPGAAVSISADPAPAIPAQPPRY
ncbi:efflux RND transporter periplasmic adaptor subunit [Bradyrhizobium diazoefficiens]|nr:efflux RND transporter periplasmic adaptor subunit [Bradyrhizobium diazoefficiens]MBR0775110.1 efflux RND transporter periplasmic adaptor subunit [Bradyrhizobium diazoefficiens]